MPDEFYITISHGKAFRLKIKKILLSDDMEIYQVRARNKTFAVQSDRPLLRTRGIKNQEPTWILNAGLISSTEVFDKVCAAIMEIVDQ
ncbi:MAG TPA: hypothetical protein VKR32_10570 [Puia sp.]|nr:hypothetical protein [Puia sp.]